MKFTPQEELDILPIGEYDAVVKRAEEKNSNAGNAMIEVILTCYAPNGQLDVFDYLVPDAMAWKVRHFCKSADIDYMKGELTEAMCVGKNVRVSLTQKKAPGYPLRNNVDDYLERNGSPSLIPAKQDDDIPF